MDVLKDKNKRHYGYISRYTSFPYYYHELDDKYIYGITSQLNDNVSFVVHQVSAKDTLDSLAEYYYGRPDLYWVIADFNKIQDPFIDLKEYFSVVNIPTISNLSFKVQ